jgi:hypothetical protein
VTWKPAREPLDHLRSRMGVITPWDSRLPTNVRVKRTVLDLSVLQCRLLKELACNTKVHRACKCQTATAGHFLSPHLDLSYSATVAHRPPAGQQYHRSKPIRGDTHSLGSGHSTFPRMDHFTNLAQVKRERMAYLSLVLEFLSSQPELEVYRLPSATLLLPAKSKRSSPVRP